ncbi:distal tail protein Dit [Gracilibacillus sp. HCP3S3_G5_1]|uniref:distal tail protein Dit n=1 Tax=unclassified Gracilibacillus TaxID=2625209 RepID=UPI003F8A4E7D
MKSLTFNGQKKSWLYLLEGRQKAPFAPRRNNLVYAPGMPGAYYKDETIDVLYITQPVGFVVKDDADALAKKDELTEWLLTGEVVELQFDDEPDRTYFAKLEGTIEDFSKFVDQRRGTLTFLCPDPYSYGPEKTFNATGDYFNVKNEGSAEAEPIFEFEVQAPITFVMIQNQLGEYNMIGQPVDADSVAFEREEKIKDDGMSSTTGWTEGTQVDNGIVSGSMSSDGSAFVVSNFGTQGQAKWYGPALKTSLSDTLQDFKVDVLVENMNSAEGVGRVEIALLDVNNNEIANMKMTDAWENLKRNRPSGFIRNGDTTRQLISIYEQREYEYWNDFNGMLRFQRIGKEWMLYVAIIRPDGTHHGRRIARFKDNQELFQQRVAQIQVHMGIFDQHPATNMKVKDLKVWKINNPSDFEIPYIAYPGDKIVFDHTNNGEVRINGEPYEASILGADYFTLEKGENQLVTMPDGALKTTGKYRERYG